MYLCITKKILIGNGFKVKIRVGYGLFKVKRLFFQMDTYIWHVLFACLVAAVLHRYLGGDGQERTFIMIRRGG